MKHLLTVAVLSLLLTCCTTQSEYRAMHRLLDSLTRLNLADSPFTVGAADSCVRYFDRHGTVADQLQACYLLGRAYHEQGEAPMALQYYQQAVDHADTTSADCNYKQLSRVYGQMGVIYYQQNLIQQQIGMIRNAVKSSLLANDTLTAMLIYEHLCSAYDRMGNLDSSVCIIDSVTKWYRSKGYKQQAALADGRKAALLIDLNRLSEVRKYMSTYERESGLFDKDGNIVKGREIYYYAKGLFYFYENRLDSAEYWFRKELSNGHDFNNQNAASKGLAQLYGKKEQFDSAAKYALYAYDMNDSVYAQMTTNDIEQITSMHNYSRHQELARKKSEEAALAGKRLWFSLTIVLFLCIIVGWLYIARKEIVSKLKETVAELYEARMEYQELSADMSATQASLAESSIRIKKLEKKLGRYSKLIYFGFDKAESSLTLSPTYQAIKDRTGKESKLTEAEWNTIRNLADEYFPGFHDFLVANLEVGSVKYKVCLLLRLHFINKEISSMLGFTAAYTSKLSSEIFMQLYGKSGGSKELSAKLSKLF